MFKAIQRDSKTVAILFFLPTIPCLARSEYSVIMLEYRVCVKKMQLNYDPGPDVQGIDFGLLNLRPIDVFGIRSTVLFP